MLVHVNKHDRKAIEKRWANIELFIGITRDEITLKNALILNKI